MITRTRLAELLDELPRLNIGVVGDLFLDRYLEIDEALDEPSVETGLTAYQVRTIRNSPGALGTVLNNLAALGVGRLVPVSVIGDDGHAFDLLRELERLPLTTDRIIRDRSRMTPTYTKPMRRSDRNEWRELNRLDVRTRAPLSTAVESELLSCIESTIAECDGVIVLDQIGQDGNGVVNEKVRQLISELLSPAAVAHVDHHGRETQKRQPGADSRHQEDADGRETLVFIDSRDCITKFTRGTLKVNHLEVLRAADVATSGEEKTPPEETGHIDMHRIRAAIRQLQSRDQHVFCTLGESGMLVAERGSEPIHVPGYPVAGPTDIVGAGDAASSGVVASLLAGASFVEAAAFGNLVASVTVQQLGTTGTASPSQLLSRWDEVEQKTSGK